MSHDDTCWQRLETQLTVLEWLVGINLVLTCCVLGMLWHVLQRLPPP